MSDARSAHLPDPVDPAPPPRRLLTAMVAATVVGVALVLTGRNGEVAAAETLVAIGWLLPTTGNALLAGAYLAISELRIRRADRRMGFLPRVGRKGLPATGRTTLYRVEYGSRLDQLCLMLARWEHRGVYGWRREEVVEHAWATVDDPVRIGEERGRLIAAAEDLEERADNERLRHEQRVALADEALVAQGELRRDSRRLAEDLAYDHDRH